MFATLCDALFHEFDFLLADTGVYRAQRCEAQRFGAKIVLHSGCGAGDKFRQALCRDGLCLVHHGIEFSTDALDDGLSGGPLDRSGKLVQLLVGQGF